MSKKYMMNYGLDAETQIRMGYDVPGYHDGMGVTPSKGFPLTNPHQLIPGDVHFEIPEESQERLAMAYLNAIKNSLDPDFFRELLEEHNKTYKKVLENRIKK